MCINSTAGAEWIWEYPISIAAVDLGNMESIVWVWTELIYFNSIEHLFAGRINRMGLFRRYRTNVAIHLLGKLVVVSAPYSHSGDDFGQ